MPLISFAIFSQYYCHHHHEHLANIQMGRTYEACLDHIVDLKHNQYSSGSSEPHLYTHLHDSGIVILSHCSLLNPCNKYMNNPNKTQFKGSTGADAVIL